MGDALLGLAVIAAMIAVPCIVGWLVGRLTGTEGRGRG